MDFCVLLDEPKDPQNTTSNPRANLKIDWRALRQLRRQPFFGS